MSEQIILTQIRFGEISAEVELSSREEPLVIDLETAHRFHLAQGTVLTQSQVEALEAEAERFAARREATRLMALRQHSIEELRLKLRQKGFGDEIAKEIISTFKERGVLDDAQYAYTLAQSLVRRKPCGRGYLLAFLESKRIDRSLASEVADTVLETFDYSDLAARALRAKWREFGQFDLETARRKAYNYLARRGFSFEATRAAFETLVTESSDGGND